MKTLFKLPVLVVTVLLLTMASLLIQGCDPEPIPGPPPVQPKVELTVDPSGILPYGAYCTVAWSSTDAKTLTINNKPNTLSGSVTSRLFRDTIFEVVARNESLSAKAEKEVKVGDWTTSKFGLITYYPWKRSVVGYTRDGVILSSHDNSNTDVFYYHKNGDLVVNYLTNIVKWSINESQDTLTLQGDLVTKFSATQTELIFYQDNLRWTTCDV